MQVWARLVAELFILCSCVNGITQAWWGYVATSILIDRNVDDIVGIGVTDTSIDSMWLW